MAIISPSLLAANWDDIKNDLDNICTSGASWFHFDVMDGKFVPAKTFSPEQLKLVSDACGIVADVHIMVEDPLKAVDDYAPMGADYITFHVESTNDPMKVIERIKYYNVKPGITLKPGTSLEEIIPYLEHIKLALVMSVEPGKGGQSFMIDQMDKVRKLDEIRKDKGYDYLIQVDGGINDATAKIATEAGADVLVSGSYIFKSQDMKTAMGKIING